MLMLLQVGSVSVSVYVCVCTLLDKLNVANREDNMKHLITVHRHRGYGVIFCVFSVGLARIKALKMLWVFQMNIGIYR